jgi:hypothetical protein
MTGSAKKNTIIGFLAATLTAGSITLAAAYPGGGMGGHGPRGDKMGKFDTDGDGKLDDTEKAAMRAAFEARHKERIARFDLNKDGVLDDAERQAMHKARAAEMFKRLDANGDGQLSLAEFQAGHHGKGGRGHHGGRR